LRRSRRVAWPTLARASSALAWASSTLARAAPAFTLSATLSAFTAAPRPTLTGAASTTLTTASSAFPTPTTSAAFTAASSATFTGSAWVRRSLRLRVLRQNAPWQQTDRTEQQGSK
jgi:hypothetical protein